MAALSKFSLNRDEISSLSPEEIRQRLGRPQPVAPQNDPFAQAAFAQKQREHAEPTGVYPPGGPREMGMAQTRTQVLPSRDAETRNHRAPAAPAAPVGTRTNVPLGTPAGHGVTGVLPMPRGRPPLRR